MPGLLPMYLAFAGGQHEEVNLFFLSPVILRGYWQ